jgi:transcription antitermination factor NusG
VKEDLLKEVNNLKLKKKKKLQQNNRKPLIKKMMIARFLQESIHRQIKRVIRSKSQEIFNNFCWIKINMSKIRK